MNKWALLPHSVDPPKPVSIEGEASHDDSYYDRTDSILELLNDHDEVEIQSSDNRWSRLLGIVLTVLLIAASVACVIVFVFLPPQASHADSQGVCYEAPACVDNTIYYNPTTGFTNDTGWSATDPASSCCQICLPNTPPVVCFDPEDTQCKSKTGNGDYDYLLLDIMWRPQFCAALKQGHDFTLTHLAGTTCLDSTGGSLNPAGNLSIHGLWPNYVGGYPQCCQPSVLIPSAIFNENSGWSEIYPQLQQQWSDPAVTLDNNCAVCSMWNHEWEKHGGCFSPHDPISYFTTALNLTARIASATAAIDALAGQIVDTATLRSFFPTLPNIICDPKDTTGDGGSGDGTIGVFSEVQTCWSSTLQPRDCPPASPAAFTTPCPDTTYIRP